MPKSTALPHKPAYISLKPGSRSAPAYHVVCMPKAIDPEVFAPEERFRQMAAILAYLKLRRANNPDRSTTVAGDIPIVTADICCESYAAFRRFAARCGVYVYPTNPNRNRSNKRYNRQCYVYAEQQKQKRQEKEEISA